MAQKDLAIIKEVFDSRNDEENVDNASFTPYVSKSHRKKMKSKTGNIKYNTRYKGEHINIIREVSSWSIRGVALSFLLLRRRML